MIKELVDAVVQAAGGTSIEALRKACEALIAQLPIEKGTIDAEEARRALNGLRKHRRFVFMRRMAQAFLDDGCRDHQVTRHFAQALIERGETIPAIRILEALIADPAISDYEWGEAKGALGRAWKDRAVRARGKRDDVAREATRASFGHYRDAWVKDPNLTYQGVNHVAIAAWDGGLFLSDDELKGAKAAAGEIFALIEAKPKPELWDYATAGEALVGLGRHDEALKWYSYYAQRNPDVFALAGSVRQLNQLWRAGEHGWGRLILAPLIGMLGDLPGGGFSVPAEALGDLAAVSRAQHQNVLGNVGARSYSWLQEGFKMAQSVAMIHKNGEPHGTGFVVRGSDLAPHLGKELLVITNAHVVSDPPLEKAATPREATVTFEILGRQDKTRRYAVSEIVWQSPPDQHDVSVLRLDEQLPGDVQPLRIASSLPSLQPETPRVYIIGHPSGREVSFSFEDNVLLDYELAIVSSAASQSPCRVHYRAPTEYGSSGSPVFDAAWGVIGVHHAGGRLIPRLNGKREVYDANEGLWIVAIKRAMAASSSPKARGKKAPAQSSSKATGKGKTKS
ncbi:serine protease [Mesorhizobium sp. GbtcB19]|uniref:serine protease n=1 Tax=Mesorhizobium sp. GbtcB19 TaxID=2824764 RepID=UPI001C304700|nr:serine protease [Mesorhizobium sp. GbtcB19]